MRTRSGYCGLVLGAGPKSRAISGFLQKIIQPAFAQVSCQFIQYARSILFTCTWNRLLQTLDPFAKDEFLELSNDNENDNQRNDNPTTVQDDRSGKRFSEMLRRVKNLEDPTVVVPQPNCYWDELDWRSPHFQNLRKFNMRILTRETLDTNANDIAEGLFALSNLRFLGLPVSGQHGSCDFLLRRLIKFYIKERVKREKRWFCLTTLELGVGYLPDRPHPMFPLNENYLAQLHDPFTTNPWMFLVDEDYLAQLTDLLTLENLQLDLDNRVRQLSSATNI